METEHKLRGVFSEGLSQDTLAWALLALWVRQFVSSYLRPPTARCQWSHRTLYQPDKEPSYICRWPWGQKNSLLRTLVNLVIVITQQHMCLYFPLSFRRSSWREFKISLITTPSQHSWGNWGIVHVIVTAEGVFSIRLSCIHWHGQRGIWDS